MDGYKCGMHFANALQKERIAKTSESAKCAVLSVHAIWAGGKDSWKTILLAGNPNFHIVNPLLKGSLIVLLLQSLAVLSLLIQYHKSPSEQEATSKPRLWQRNRGKNVGLGVLGEVAESCGKMSSHQVILFPVAAFLLVQFAKTSPIHVQQLQTSGAM